jgi:hypothetical protein
MRARLRQLLALVLPPALARAQLFGLSSSVQLSRYGADGSATAIGPARPSLLQAQNLAALDAAGGVYYFVEDGGGGGAPSRVGLSTASGAVVSQAALPFVEQAFVGVGQLLAWAPDLGLAVLAGQAADGTHLVGTVNVTSGAWAPVANVSRSDDDVLGGAAVYVPATGDFIFNLGVDNGTEIANVAVNLRSGAVRFGANTQAGNLESMSLNARDGKVYGLSLHIVGEGFNRSVSSMDPATLDITEIGVVPGFGIESGGIGTVDSAAQTLFWIGMAAPYVPNTPLFLVQVSLADASVVSSAQLCQTDPGCPWSLEFRG